MNQDAFSLTLFWPLVFVLGLGTFGLRLSFIQLYGWTDEFPPQVDRALAFVPATILAALVFPELFPAGNPILETVAHPRVLAGGVAALTAWRTGSMIRTIGVGMGVLWLAQFVLG